MWIVPKSKPSLKRPREWLAHKMVVLARQIYPASEDVTAFYATLMHDMMIHGKSVTRIDPMDFDKEV